MSVLALYFCFVPGFYESSEGQSPKGKSSCAELTETVPCHVYANDRPKSVGEKNEQIRTDSIDGLSHHLFQSFSLYFYHLWMDGQPLYLELN